MGCNFLALLIAFIPLHRVAPSSSRAFLVPKVCTSCVDHLCLELGYGDLAFLQKPQNRVGEDGQTSQYHSIIIDNFYFAP